MKESQLQVYTGDGKGKTTAAVGLAVRAAGRGKSVKFVQFLKGRTTGEMYAFEKLEGVDFYQASDSKKFFYTMTQKEQEEIKKQTKQFLLQVFEWLGHTDVLILDEALDALSIDIIGKEDIIKIIDGRKDTEIVLTGREAPEYVLQRAGLLTQMKKIKHYYDSGVKAREGIEF